MRENADCCCGATFCTLRFAFFRLVLDIRKGEGMKASFRLAAACVLIAVGGIAAVSHATNYSLWVNGRTGGGQLGNYADFAYWGPGTTAAGVNKKSVNWDGRSHISDQNYLVRNALD